MTIQQVGVNLALNGAKFLIEITPELTTEGFVARVRQRLNVEIDAWSLEAAGKLLESFKARNADTKSKGHGIYFYSQSKAEKEL